jgi:hypothetical protein
MHYHNHDLQTLWALSGGQFTRREVLRRGLRAHHTWCLLRFS